MVLDGIHLDIGLELLIGKLFPFITSLHKDSKLKASKIDVNCWYIKYGVDEPDHIDRLFLYFFLKFSIEEKSSVVKIKNFNSILKMCGLSSGSMNYKRLLRSCVKWKSVSICLRNNIFEGSLIFGVFDLIVYDNKKRDLLLNFNTVFYECITSTRRIKKFFISGEDYFFVRPTSGNLYKVLRRDIDAKNALNYEAFELSSKINLKRKFPSQIRQTIVAAVREVNQKTNLKVGFNIFKRTDKKTMITFEKNNLPNKKKERFKKMTGKSLIEILNEYENEPQNLINLMQDVQKSYNYISESHLKILCDYVGVPLSHGYSVATFYRSFKTEPQGKNDIKVCLGTACHLKGGQHLINGLERILDTKPGQPTKDLKFVFDSVNCVGACALAPVVVINDEYKPNVNLKKLKKELKTAVNV